VPLEGAQAFVEQCAASSAGQSFSFVVGPTPPAGQFQLVAYASLCLEQNATGSPTQFVFLRPCDSSNAHQLWNVEKSIEDGPFLTGPVTCAANKGVMDIYYSNYADDTPIDTYVRVLCGRTRLRKRAHAHIIQPLTLPARAPPRSLGRSRPTRSSTSTRARACCSSCSTEFA
jgi:hypothetical protein